MNIRMLNGSKVFGTSAEVEWWWWWNRFMVNNLEGKNAKSNLPHVSLVEYSHRQMSHNW